MAAATATPAAAAAAAQQQQHSRPLEERLLEKSAPSKAAAAFSKAAPAPGPDRVFHDEDGELVVTDATTLCNCAESVMILGELYAPEWDAATYQMPEKLEAVSCERRGRNAGVGQARS